MRLPWKRRSAQSEVEAGLPRIFPRMWRYAYSLSGTRDGADDLAQAACLRAMERASQFIPGTHLDRWVFRITRNLWMSELRRRQVRKLGGLSVAEAEEIADPAQNPEQDYDRRAVLKAVLDLPEAQRETVFLVYIEGYSYQEAADLLEIPLATVMSRLATARGRLSNRFRDQKGVSDAK